MSHIAGNATYICVAFECEQESYKNTSTYISNILVNWDTIDVSLRK